MPSPAPPSEQDRWMSVPSRAVLFGLVACGLLACSPDLPTAGAPVRSETVPVATAVVEASAPLRSWHQGFESDVTGWYDAGTDLELGWCGSIEAVDARPRASASLRPSVGNGYAEVRAGPCNDYWSAQGIPAGAPYAPGPDAVLYSESWPAAGYVSELDVYLDPAWSGTAVGSLGLFLNPTPYPASILQLAATIMPRDYQLGTPHPAPHWFASVDAVPGEAALLVEGHRIEEAGWYSFRFIFSDQRGEVRAAFELRDRTGGVLTRVNPLLPEALAGPIRVPFAESLLSADYGSGHLWFFDAPLNPATFAPVPVAIDEHRVRPGTGLSPRPLPRP
jgi:hypothetical protein